MTGLAEVPSIGRGAHLEIPRLTVQSALEHIAQHPHDVAVEFQTRSLTWEQLGSRANQVASVLQARGIGAGHRVVVSAHMSEVIPVSLLGVLLSGAAFVPVDAAHPDDRLRAIVDAVGADVVLTDRSVAAPGCDQVTLGPDSLDGAAWDDASRATIDGQPGPGDIAYVVFTSGSTGQPNGVAISHSQIASSTVARGQVYPEPPTRYALLSSISFDSSMVGLFWSLIEGFTLLLSGREVVQDPDALIAGFAASRPSHMLCVPTLYAQLLDRRTSSDTWPGHVIVAGEACSPALVQRHFSDVPAARLTNEYGPTEATIWATSHHCEPSDEAAPIGRPVPNSWSAVIDQDGAVVPEGTPGELVLGGPHIAPGYLNGRMPERFGRRSDLSAGIPGDSDDRYFLTGDRVVQRDDVLFFIGRADDQLNIAGIRVEPGEIEAVLAAVDGVTSAVVVASGSTGVGDNSDVSDSDTTSSQPVVAPRLFAHIEGAANEAALRASMQGALPKSHHPAVYVFHETLPRTPNGKVDRRQLAELSAPPATAHEPGPVNSTATQPGQQVADVDRIRALFTRALQGTPVGPDDSFFDVGGDSLAAFALISDIEREFDRRVGTGVIHQAPTPRLFAQALLADEGDDIAIVEVEPDGDATPIFMLHHVGARSRFARAISGELGPGYPVFAVFDETAVISPTMEPNPKIKQPVIHEIVERYANSVERRWPHGPIILVGHCQGGIFAHEVALLLVKRGRTVSSVIVVNDWHAPGIDTFVKPFTELRLELKREAFRPLLKAKARGMQRRLTSYVAPKHPDAIQYRLVSATNHAYENHDYGKYDGRVVVLRREEDPRCPTPGSPTGWGDVLSDLTIHRVEGEPFSGQGLTKVGQVVKAEVDRDSADVLP